MTEQTEKSPIFGGVSQDQAQQQIPLQSQYQVPMQQAPMQGYAPVQASMMNAPAPIHGTGQVYAPMGQTSMQPVPIQGYVPLQSQMGPTVAFAGGTIYASIEFSSLS